MNSGAQVTIPKQFQDLVKAAVIAFPITAAIARLSFEKRDARKSRAHDRASRSYCIFKDTLGTYSLEQQLEMRPS